MENRVYVTNSNMFILSTLFTKGNSNMDLNQELFKIDQRWFTTTELQTMITAKMLFEFPEQLLVKIEKLKIEKNSRTMSSFNGAAYHADCNCEKLLSDYESYKIPDEIGEEEEEEFKIFFQKILDAKLPDAIKIHQFQQKYPDIDYPEYMHFENSGVDSMDNFSIRDLENQIDSEIKKVEKIINQNPWLTANMCKLAWRSKEKEREKELKKKDFTKYQLNVFGEIEKIKQTIKNLIITYYMLKNSGENIAITKTILQVAGFNPCSKCFPKK